MVKVPNRPPTPAEPRSSGKQPQPKVRPSLTVEVALVAGSSVHDRAPVSAQVRGEKVRLLCRGQVVGWVDDAKAAETIIQCHEAGGRYEGHVAAVASGEVVILLEGHG